MKIYSVKVLKVLGVLGFQKQIKDGLSEAEIRKSWEPALSEFKKTRKKYLLYTDFE